MNLKFVELRDKKIAELKLRGESLLKEREMARSFDIKLERLICMFESKISKMAAKIEVLEKSAAVSRVDIINAGVRTLYDKDTTNDEFNVHKYTEQYFYNDAFDTWFDSVKFDESKRNIWESFTSLEKKEFDSRPEQYRVSHDYTCEYCNMWLNETERANLAALRTRNDPILYALNRIYSKLRLPELSFLPEAWFEDEMLIKLRSLIEANTTIKQTDDNTRLINWERLTDYTADDKDEWKRMKIVISPLNIVPATLKSASIVCKAWKHEDIDHILNLL